MFVYPESGEIEVRYARHLIPRRIRRLLELNSNNHSTVRQFVEAATPNFILKLKEGSSSPSRAFHQVRRRAMAYGLTTHATLTYDNNSPKKVVRRDITRFAERLRKTYGPVAYVAVAESGAQFGGLHWHCLLPNNVVDKDIERCWQRSRPVITRATDYDGLTRLIEYVTKTFFDSKYERDFCQRYTHDRVNKVAAENHEGLTFEELDILIEQLTGPNLSTLTVRDYTNKWIIATYRWKPTHLNEIDLTP